MYITSGTQVLLSFLQMMIIDHRLTFDLFMARSNLCLHTFVREKVEKSFSQYVKD